MIAFIPERAASIEKAGMSKSKGRQADKRLVDMSTPPPPDPVYEPPEDAEEYEFPHESPRPETELKVRVRQYRGRYVYFAIMQMLQVDGCWREIARIDCDHGYVHRHQFNSAGEDLWGRRRICDIPAGEEGQRIVDRMFHKCIRIMQDEVDENVGRWHGVGA
jgi:hypothetical protein